MAEKIEYKLIDELVFDPENPRLPKKLRGVVKEEDIIEWMLNNENVIELMGSIGEKGYFPAEPLLVTLNKKKKYEVIEGNRRLSAVKLLNKPGLATTKKNSVDEAVSEASEIPKKLPVIVFDKKEEVIVYLGYRHITGIKTWSSLAKAKYLETLRKTLNLKNADEEYRTIAKIIGSNLSYVRSLLTGLKIYDVIEENKFFNIKDLDEVSVEFGVLYTATSRKNIAHFVGVDLNADNPVKNVNVKHLHELTSWMFEKNSENFTRLGESRNIKDLDKVVSNATALKVFRAGKPLSEAVLLTDKPQVIFKKSIAKSLDNLKIAQSQLHNIDKPDSSHLEGVEEILKLGSDLKILIKGKISG